MSTSGLFFGIFMRMGMLGVVLVTTYTVPIAIAVSSKIDVHKFDIM